MNQIWSNCHLTAWFFHRLLISWNIISPMVLYHFTSMLRFRYSQVLHIVTHVRCFQFQWTHEDLYGEVCHMSYWKSHIFYLFCQGCSNATYLSTRGWRAPPEFPEWFFHSASLQTASTSPQERRLEGSRTGSRCPSAGWRFCQYCTSILPWRHLCTWEMGYQTQTGSHALLMGQNLVKKGVGWVRLEGRWIALFILTHCHCPAVHKHLGRSNILAKLESQWEYQTLSSNLGPF